jgi:hypothetical protein
MTAERRGFSLRVFLPDGDPDGIKLVEKSNWSGRGLVFPRTLFGRAKSRPDVERAGVYVLVGETADSPVPLVYIGEGDPVRPRFEKHGRDKDFWTRGVMFTSKDENLHKAHVQHLEARLVALAIASKRCSLDNINVPQPPSLSESDVAEAEGFLDNMLLCLPILGFHFFEPPLPMAPRGAELLLMIKDVNARGHDTTQGFVVRRGARATKTVSSAIVPSLAQMRSELIRQGVLRDAGSVYELAQDYTFTSPSMASGVLLGRSSNGRVEWRTTDGRTLKSIQDAETES